MWGEGRVEGCICIYRHRCVCALAMVFQHNQLFPPSLSPGWAQLHHGQLALGVSVTFPELWEGLTSWATCYVGLNRHFGQLGHFPWPGVALALLRGIKRSRRANIFIWTSSCLESLLHHLFHSKIFSWQCAPWPWEGAEIDGGGLCLGPGALKLCGLELSHTGQVVPSCAEVRQWPVMKGERLPVSSPLPQLDLLSLWYCLLMEDYEGWEDGRNFPSFESLMQMTPLKGRSCWEPACSCRAVSHGARVNLGKQLWDTGLDNAWNGGGLLKLSKSTC